MSEKFLKINKTNLLKMASGYFLKTFICCLPDGGAYPAALKLTLVNNCTLEVCKVQNLHFAFALWSLNRITFLNFNTIVAMEKSTDFSLLLIFVRCCVILLENDN